MTTEKMATVVAATAVASDKIEVQYRMDEGDTVWTGHLSTGNFALPDATAEALAEWLEGREVEKSW